MTQQVTLEELLGQLKRIPAEWLDDDSRKVLESIQQVVDQMGNIAEETSLAALVRWQKQTSRSLPGKTPE